MKTTIGNGLCALCFFAYAGAFGAGCWGGYDHGHDRAVYVDHGHDHDHDRDHDHDHDEHR
jgi:hypothetical protein